MGNLTVAVRSLSGAVLAADSAYGSIGEENPSIRSVQDQFGVLIEPDMPLGQGILDRALEDGEGDFDSYSDLVESCVMQARELHQEHQDAGEPIRVQTGLIFTGPGSDANASSRFHIDGIHTGRNYSTIPFHHAFGGGLHSISRYLSQRMADGPLTIKQAKYFAAFAVYQTRNALGDALEPYIAMATVTYDSFQRLPRRELDRLLARVSKERFRLKAELGDLFLDAPGIEQPKTYS